MVAAAARATSRPPGGKNADGLDEALRLALASRGRELRPVARRSGSTSVRSGSASRSATAPAPSPRRSPSCSAAAARKLDHQRIADLVVEEEAELVVVGLPLNMNGSLGPAAKAAIAEAQALATVVGVPVETFDERRTTVAADAVLMEFKMRAPGTAARDRQGRRGRDAAVLARRATPIGTSSRDGR